MKSLLSLTLALMVASISAEVNDNELGFLALNGQYIPNVEGVQSVTVAGGPNSGASAVLINALLALGGAAILPSLLRSPVAERRSNLIEENNFIGDDVDVKSDRLGSWLRSRKFSNRGFKAKTGLKHKKSFNSKKGFSLKRVFGSKGMKQKRRNIKKNIRFGPKNFQTKSFRAPQLRRRAGGLRRPNKPRRQRNSLFSLFKKSKSSKQNLRQRRKKFLRNPAKFFRPKVNAVLSPNKRGPLKKLRNQMRKPLNAMRGNSKLFVTKRPRIPQIVNTESTIEKPLNPLPSEHPQGQQQNQKPQKVPVYHQKDPEASLRDSRPADVYEPRPGYLPALFRDKLAPSKALKGNFEPFDNDFDTKKSFDTNFDKGFSKNSGTSKSFNTDFSTTKGFNTDFSTTKGFDSDFGPRFDTTKSFDNELSTEHNSEKSAKSFHDEHDALWDQMRFPLADIKSDNFHDYTNYVDNNDYVDNNGYVDNEETDKDVGNEEMDKDVGNEWTGSTIGFDGFDDFKKIPNV